MVELDIDYDVARGIGWRGPKWHPSNPLCGDYVRRYEDQLRRHPYGYGFEWGYTPPRGSDPRPCRCSGRACGEPDGCGGVCCNAGSGCRPAATCEPCMRLDGCGAACQPAPDRTYCAGGQCEGGACIPSTPPG
jgi:hypothetical protein